MCHPLNKLMPGFLDSNQKEKQVWAMPVVKGGLRAVSKIPRNICEEAWP